MFFTVMELREHTGTGECRWSPVSTMMDLLDARILYESLTEEDVPCIIVLHERVDYLKHIAGPDLWEGCEIPSEDDIRSKFIGNDYKSRH